MMDKATRSARDLERALYGPDGAEFVTWAFGVLDAAQSPREAVRTITKALMPVTYPYIGEAEAHKLVDAWVDGSIPTTSTRAQAHAYLTGLMFGGRLGRLTAACAAASGGGGTWVVDFGANGGVPHLGISPEAVEPYSRPIGIDIGLTPGLAKHRTFTPFRGKKPDAVDILSLLLGAGPMPPGSTRGPDAAFEGVTEAEANDAIEKGCVAAGFVKGADGVWRKPADANPTRISDEPEWTQRPHQTDGTGKSATVGSFGANGKAAGDGEDVTVSAAGGGTN